MRDSTRRVIVALRARGYEVSSARRGGTTRVQVFDPRRNAESSFGFGAEDEASVVDRMTEEFGLCVEPMVA